MSRTILLADDSVTIQKIVELTCAQHDYEVETFTDGEAALEQLQHAAPDIVLASVHLPGNLDGYALCRAAKQQHSGLPVLLMVGAFEDFSEDDAWACGADGFLKKPFDSADLFARIQQLLERQQARLAAEPDATAAPPAQADAPDASDVQTPGLEGHELAASAPPPPPGEAVAPAAVAANVATASVATRPEDAGFEMMEPKATPPGDVFRYLDAPAEAPAAEPADAQALPHVPKPPQDVEVRPTAPLTAVAEARAPEADTPAAATPEVPQTEDSGALAADAQAAPGQLQQDEPLPFQHPRDRRAEQAAVEASDTGNAVSGADEAAPAAEEPSPALPIEGEAGATVVIPTLSADGSVDDGIGAEPTSPEPTSPELTPDEPATTEAAPAEGSDELSVTPPASIESEAATFEASSLPPAEPRSDASADAGSDSTRVEAPATRLTDDEIERIARRVAELVAKDTVRDVVWEVVPDIAEAVVRERVAELEAEVDQQAVG